MKKPAYKAKSVVVVYYGSNDLTDPLEEKDVNVLAKKLGFMNPNDVKVLPTVMVGTKLVKLQTESFTIVEGRKFTLEHRNPRLRNSIPVKPKTWALSSLDSALSSKGDKVALVPHYLRIVAV